jgi:DNA polymerase III alpha subunit
VGQEQWLPGGAGPWSGAGSLVAYVLKITDLDPHTTCCSSVS